MEIKVKKLEEKVKKAFQEKPEKKLTVDNFPMTHKPLIEEMCEMERKKLEPEKKVLMKDPTTGKDIFATDEMAKAFKLFGPNIAHDTLEDALASRKCVLRKNDLIESLKKAKEFAKKLEGKRFKNLKEHIDECIAEYMKNPELVDWNEASKGKAHEAIVNDYEFVNHPSHYNNYSIEVIDMFERIYGREMTAQWCEMTALKYRMRAGTKPGQDVARDLDKERWYLEKAEELRKK